VTLDFDPLAADYDRLRPAGQAWEELSGRTLAVLGDFRRLVDVGCGTGRFAAFAKARRGGRVWGVDPAPEMLRRARARPDAGGIGWKQASYCVCKARVNMSNFRKRENCPPSSLLLMFQRGQISVEERITISGHLDTCEFCLPVSMGSASSPPGRFSLLLNGKPALDFDVALHDQSWHSTDGKIQMSYLAMEDSPQESNGILSLSISASLLAPGRWRRGHSWIPAHHAPHPRRSSIAGRCREHRVPQKSHQKPDAFSWLVEPEPFAQPPP